LGQVLHFKIQSDKGMKLIIKRPPKFSRIILTEANTSLAQHITRPAIYSNFIKVIITNMQTGLEYINGCGTLPWKGMTLGFNNRSKLLFSDGQPGTPACHQCHHCYQ
jgi:hypothetical protein